MTASAGAGDPAAVPNRGRLMAAVLTVTAFGPFSMDMYLPAWPRLASALHASDGQVQHSLGSFLVGFAAGQLVYGPLSDRLGRRPPLIFGCVLYTIASLLCALAPTADALVDLRLLQGFGACAGGVIARAIIRDCLPGDQAARALSLLMLVLGGSALVAPSLGGLLLRLFDWQALFGVLAGIGGLASVVSYFWLPETRPRALRDRTPARSSLAGYADLARNWEFLRNALTGAFAQGGVFAYLSGLPFLASRGYGWSTTAVGLLIGANMLGQMAAFYANAMLVVRAGAGRMLRGGLLLAGVGAAMLLAGATIMPDAPPALILGPLFVFLASNSFIGGNAMAGALNAVPPGEAGVASAAAGALQFALGAGIGALVVAFPQRSPTPMAVVILICVVSGMVVQAIPGRRASTTPLEA